MSKPNCLHNPAKPSKAFRDVLVRRRKADAAVLHQKMMPVLLEEWTAYKTNGRVLSDASAVALKKELADALESALDGTLDLDALECSYCVFKQKEARRQEAAEAEKQVRAPHDARARAHAARA